MPEHTFNPCLYAAHRRVSHHNGFQPLTLLPRHSTRGGSLRGRRVPRFAAYCELSLVGCKTPCLPLPLTHSRLAAASNVCQLQGESLTWQRPQQVA